MEHSNDTGSTRPEQSERKSTGKIILLFGVLVVIAAVGLTLSNKKARVHIVERSLYSPEHEEQSTAAFKLLE